MPIDDKGIEYKLPTDRIKSIKDKFAEHGWAIDEMNILKSIAAFRLRYPKIKGMFLTIIPCSCSFLIYKFTSGSHFIQINDMPELLSWYNRRLIILETRKQKAAQNTIQATQQTLATT